MRHPGMFMLTAGLCICISGTRVLAQESFSDLRSQYVSLVESAYGQDQELVNGKLYYDHHPLSKGSPYLFDGILQQGSVILRGVRYEKVLLRYNINDQQVEVNYSTITGARNQVVVVRDRLDAFSIGSLSFQKLILEEDREIICQVAGFGNAVFYIYWEKRLIPVQNDTRYLESYSASRSHIRVKLESDFHEIRNLRHLYSLLPDAMQKDLKRFLRSRSFNFRTATPMEMDVVLKEVSTILNQGSA